MRARIGVGLLVAFGVLLAWQPPSAAYDDVQGRFRIDCPQGWREDVADDGSGAIFTAPAGDARIVVLPVPVTAQATLADVVQAYEGFVKQSQPQLGLTLKREGQVEVAGVTALEREYSARAGEDSGRILTTFVKQGEWALAIHASAKPEEAFARYEDSFRACLASLRLGGARAAPDADEARRKLAALEQARAAGILSQEEYERKKAEILATLPALDEETRSKLAALDAARAAGILSEQEYAQKRAELLRGRAAPVPDAPAAPDAGKDPAAKGLPALTNRKGKVYRHVAGFSFWYPDGWTIQEHDTFLQLIPPNAGQSPEGPTELYFVSAEDASSEGITDASDPRVAAYLDQQVLSLSPALQRTGGAREVAMSAGKGLLHRWEGKSPRGDAIDARAYVSIMRGYATVLVAIGFKERIRTREEEMNRIFASFGIGQGERDPALVGRWTLVGVTAITNQSPFETDWSRAQLASKTESTLVFAADGTWQRHDKSHMLVGAGGIWLEDNSESTQRGRWNAGNGTLFMVWEDSSWDDFEYRVQRTARGVELRTVRGKHGEVWTKTE